MLKFNTVIKRIIDIIASALALIVFSPIFCLLALAIKLDSKGPIFFRQDRLGKDGTVFQMLKFRSMVANAEQMGAGLFNYAGDPRVTRVGRFLRDSSLDELPQLFNVLVGKMSLVGPRPAVTYELGDFQTLNRKYKKRFSVKPGITGLAQVSGRNELSWDVKVELDNEYIDRFLKEGIFLDLRILIKTAARVFERTNIYEEKGDDSLSDIEAAKRAEEEIIRKAHEVLPEE